MNAPLTTKPFTQEALAKAIDALPDPTAKKRVINIDPNRIQPLEVVALLGRLVAISEGMTHEREQEFRELMAPLVIEKYARFNEAIRDLHEIACGKLKQPTVGINEDFSLEDGRTMALRLLAAAKEKGDAKLLDGVVKVLMKHNLINLSDVTAKAKKS